ncbi:MAG: glycerate kinase [Eubacterium sp.]|jgi:glycerate kinase|nr:glycerate kinase [Eubacterium sp.]MCH4047747.1 glycerate kinase [Eubacterium sp.]MCH4078519.1 glycerate kinase [Eubacterium sp.]MCH4109663.1 glycerate kinase [Eubacterium sp.]MCI1307800.1 glycerate kinase [Eubacterium sp.]
MKIVIAIDSFKGCMTSSQAGEAAKTGILRVLPDADVIVRPMADGGEGTVDALAAGRVKEDAAAEVQGPLGDPVSVKYAVLDGSTAVMEMSAASGITLVRKDQLNPYKTSTYGVGQMIKDALDRGCREIILGIGGSATNDGGAGMLQALGFDLLDEEGSPIPLGAEGLGKLSEIRTENADSRLSECRIRVVSDVGNPLTGEQGSSAVFGPQKGATPEMVKQLDQWLSHYAEVSSACVKDADPDYPGSGAAGGLGFALRTFLNVELVPGVDLVLDFTGMEEVVKDADYLITGEGQLDRQTVMGKAPSGIAGLGEKYDIPVLAFSGSVTDDARYCNEHGITAFFPILRRICSLEEAMDTETAQKNMADTAEQVFRVISAGQK